VTELLDLAKSPGEITLPRLWRALAPSDREVSLRSLADDEGSRPQLIRLAMSLPRFRAFRPKAVARLTDTELVSAIASSTQLPPDLVQTALIAMHLPARAPMLGAFLEALGIPHEGGLITDGTTVELPKEPDRMTAAIARLAGEFPRREVTIYLLSLVAMDPITWKPLAAVLPGSVALLGE
jgi:hypothetical protein